MPEFGFRVDFRGKGFGWSFSIFCKFAFVFLQCLWVGCLQTASLQGA